MKKSFTILGAVLMIASGCASWHKDRSESSTEMSEPAGAERSSGSMKSNNGSTNQLDKSSSQQERQDSQSNPSQPQE